MKRILGIITLLCLVLAIKAQKQNLKVLYVGGSPDIETITRSTPLPEAVMQKSIKERMASFTSFLKSKFRTVKTVDGKDWTPELSAQYDVTIFDAKTKLLKERVMDLDANGQVIHMEAAEYLPMDFNCPSIFIANASENLGRSVGFKNDWFCLCLDNMALGWNKSHDIFNKPFKVNIKASMQPTPEAAKEYGPIYKQEIPENVEMWQVQTPSFLTTPEYRIGMVSRPGGYLDSPETEIISGGKCTKSLDAIAIGRHGSFLHWGFSASPKYLTEAGKAAFANAVVYISKFKGARIIARKMNENIITRDHELVSVDYFTSQESVDERNRITLLSYLPVDSVKQVIKEKRARGEELNAAEVMYENLPIKKPEPITLDEYLKERYPHLYHHFGNDHKAYVDYYEKNAGWFYPDAAGYHLDIDEDVRLLGIANNDVRMLDKAISMLENGKQKEKEMAMRILKRYTLCRFTDAKEWRKWYDDNRSRLFFTESGGWLWLVNSMEAGVMGNDYQVLFNEQKAAYEANKAKSSSTSTPKAEKKVSLTTNDMNPVAHDAHIETEADGTKVIVIRQKVHVGYHTYCKVSKEDPYIPTEIKLSLPEGVKEEGELQCPSTHTIANGTTVYEGEGEFRQKLSGSAKGSITISIHYQCCDDQRCLMPTDQQIVVEL